MCVPSRYSGSAVLLKRPLRPLSTWYDFYDQDQEQPQRSHHEEGRVVIMEFERFMLLARGWCLLQTNEHVAVDSGSRCVGTRAIAAEHREQHGGIV